MAPEDIPQLVYLLGALVLIAPAAIEAIRRWRNRR